MTVNEDLYEDRLKPLTLLVAVAMLSSVQAPQAAARTAQAGGTISGTIVGTGNTQPLSGALVTLVRSELPAPVTRAARQTTCRDGPVPTAAIASPLWHPDATG